MSGWKNLRGRLPYDDRDLGSIIRHAAKLTGRTLSEIFNVKSGIVCGVRTKGYFGQIVAFNYFYIDNDNEPVPDFKEVGLELKVTPMKSTNKGLISKERLVLGIINYNDVPIRGFRIFTDKNSHILIIFYLWNKDQDVYDYRFLKVINWVPTPEELRIIKEDWDVIERYILRGEAHLLSERHTKYLAACIKGAGHGKDVRAQPNSRMLAKQRALSFKSSFMTSLYRSHKDVNETLTDTTDTDSESVFNAEWSEDDTFNEYVLHHFDRFVGRKCHEIEAVLGIDLNDSSKQYYNTLTLAMLGVFHKKHIKEFDGAGISIKTIRLRTDGRPKESMSFRAFKYEELVEQTWETSDFCEEINHEFFFPVFQFNEKDAAKEKRKDLVFKGAFFWSVPDSDFAIIERVWNDTKGKILSERFDNFVKASDGLISHVRPHGRNKDDRYPYKGKYYTKRCFWFNDTYIERIVHENLGGRSSPKKFDKPRHDRSYVLPYLTFPYRHDGPARRFEFFGVPTIAFCVAIEFPLPEISMCLRQWQIAPGTPVPKAPVDKDRYPSPWVCDVRPPGHIFPIQAISREPGITKPPAQHQFWSGVPPLVGPHHLRRGDVGGLWIPSIGIHRSTFFHSVAL